jgi:hypothetical protein
MKHKDNVQYSHNFNLSTGERYYQVSIDGWGSTHTFALRLKLKQEDFHKIVKDQFSALIIDFCTLVFTSLEDFNKFKEYEY